MVPERYPSLEEAGIRQLYPPTSTAATATNGGRGGGVDKGKELTVDRTIELRRLSKSLLLNYLELVGVMGMAPEQVCSPSSFSLEDCKANLFACAVPREDRGPRNNPLQHAPSH